MRVLDPFYKCEHSNAGLYEDFLCIYATSAIQFTAWLLAVYLRVLHMRLIYNSTQRICLRELKFLAPKLHPARARYAKGMRVRIYGVALMLLMNNVR